MLHPLNFAAVPRKEFLMSTDPFDPANVAPVLFTELPADLGVSIYRSGRVVKTLVLATGFTNGQAHRFIERILPLYRGTELCFSIDA